jgi:tetratricopeptide (TPR) repeat protein
MFRRKSSRSPLTLVLALSLVFSVAAGVAAQNTSSISGEVMDPEGKPWPGLVVKFKSDRGQSAETTTGPDGKFKQVGLSNGKWNYEVYNGTDKIWEGVVERLGTGQDHVLKPINYKELIAADPKAAEARKKQEEERGKFENMKASFDAGVLALQQADTLQSTLAKTPRDQKAAVQQQIADAHQKAVTSFQEAEKAADPKDANLALVLGNLGAAYKGAGQYEQSIDAYTRAIALKPDPSYYVGFAEAQARSGKMPEAMASCANIPSASSTANAATCYRNLGIVSYNESKDKEAVEALRKATELEPKNPQAWYLLGASLVRMADYKTEGSKISVTLQPGTIEAYQKAIEADPNGPYAASAKEGLAQLEQMGAGIDTKVKAGKKKS